MCGRFTLTLEPDDLAEQLLLDNIPSEYRPRYNIAPSQPVMALLDPAKRTPDFLRWGLIPSWSKDPSIGSQLINARSETAFENPSFRAAFQRRRCLVAADGFYEWKKSAAKTTPTQPYFLCRKDRKAFWIAGLWEIWQGSDGSEIRTVTLLTTVPNEVVLPIHDRMPVIFTREQGDAWILGTSQSQLIGMLRPFASDLMDAYPVSRSVNKPDLDNRELIVPISA